MKTFITCDTSDDKSTAYATLWRTDGDTVHLIDTSTGYALDNDLGDKLDDFCKVDLGGIDYAFEKKLRKRLREWMNNA